MPLPPLRFDGPDDAETDFAFAHGAGIGWESDFMNAFATGLGSRGLRVVRFEFPYMQQMSTGSSRRPPDRMPLLLETFHFVLDHLGRERCIIGGKSMGGRVASMLAAEKENEELPVKGCVCLGYPFHAPDKPEKVRTGHMEALMTRTLILQGTRDPFGTYDEVPGYALSDAIRVHWLEDGDHHLVPRKQSGRTQAQNWNEAIDAFAEFVAAL